MGYAHIETETATMDVLFYYAKDNRQLDRNDTATVVMPTLNSENERLHDAQPGDSVWVVTWEGDQKGYTLVEQFVVAAKYRNKTPDGIGSFGLEPDVARSVAMNPHSRPCVDAIMCKLDKPPKPRASSFQGPRHVRPLSLAESAAFHGFINSTARKVVAFGSHRL